MRPVLTLARYVLLEALRSGLPWLGLACVVAALAAAAFVSQVAIAESRETQAAVGAALLRAGAVLIVALHVVASVAREANDKGIELLLAFPISRPAYYLGKLLGHAAAAAGLATLCALATLLWAKPADALAWWISLAAETALVATAALFFATVLSQATAAIFATLGLYLLARSFAAIQAIASGPLAEESMAAQATRWALEALGLLLPRLDAVTRAEWLLYGVATAGELWRALVESGLYIALLAAAGLFDFSRRNL